MHFSIVRCPILTRSRLRSLIRITLSCASISTAIYRNCLRFECSLAYQNVDSKQRKKYTQQQQQQQQHLALEFIWLIPFQSTFCSFSLIVFPCRVRFFSLFFNFFLYFVCLVRINDMPFSYCSCCCCWSLIVVVVVAAVNFKYFLFPCIRRSTICSSSECDGLLLFSSFISFFLSCVCVYAFDRWFGLKYVKTIESNKKFHFDVWSLPFIDSFRLIWSTICIILSFILINVICSILVPSFLCVSVCYLSLSSFFCSSSPSFVFSYSLKPHEISYMWNQALRFSPSVFSFLFI